MTGTRPFHAAGASDVWVFAQNPCCLPDRVYQPQRNGGIVFQDVFRNPVKIPFGFIQPDNPQDWPRAIRSLIFASSLSKTSSCGIHPASPLCVLCNLSSILLVCHS